MFIKLTDSNFTSVYIKADSIKAVYYDEDEHSTAIDYSIDSTLYVRETPDEAIEKVFKSKRGGE